MTCKNCRLYGHCPDQVSGGVDENGEGGCGGAEFINQDINHYIKGLKKWRGK